MSLEVPQIPAMLDDLPTSPAACVHPIAKPSRDQVTADSKPITSIIQDAQPVPNSTEPVMSVPVEAKPLLKVAVEDIAAHTTDVWPSQRATDGSLEQNGQTNRQ